MPEADTRKIAPHHLEREACLYVRQSSLRQVMQHTESTRRQYGLSQRATALGWPAERIQVIDEDQGKSGAYTGNRSGFRDLMGNIGGGEVGIVLSLDVSRLARDNAGGLTDMVLGAVSSRMMEDAFGVRIAHVQDQGLRQIELRAVRALADAMLANGTISEVSYG